MYTGGSSTIQSSSPLLLLLCRCRRRAPSPRRICQRSGGGRSLRVEKPEHPGHTANAVGRQLGGVQADWVLWTEIETAENHVIGVWVSVFVSRLCVPGIVCKLVYQSWTYVYWVYVGPWYKQPPCSVLNAAEWNRNSREHVIGLSLFCVSVTDVPLGPYANRPVPLATVRRC